MASGLPDYYRGVDIAYQALAQMIVRPKYGGAVWTIGVETVDANAVKSLVSVSGKGMIYGGFLYLDHTATQKTGIAMLKIDGDDVAGLALDYMDKYSIDKSWAHPFYLLGYDDINFIYSVALSYGLTFEESFEILYEEQDGGTPQVWANATYALI